MSDYLKGNFETKRKVTGTKAEASAEEKFEREALRRLGGSIAFVSRKKFVWEGDGEEGGKEMSAEGRAEQYEAQRDKS